ncbi:MAG: nucleotidyltransferase domain-containing protein [Lachnospiraceae bacterium]|nr:nucleotidyltransferase domain-containing protein [Lachnospiraceae bacterium]
MTIDVIRKKTLEIVDEYPIKSIVLFGSRAEGTNREDSDVDLIVEFSTSVTLLTLARLRIRLEELLGVDVDVIHGPMRDTDLLDVGKVVELYAA